MNLEHVMQMIDSEGFKSIVDKECSKKILNQATDYIGQFYGNKEPQNRQKDFIVALAPLVGMLKISEEKKQEFYQKYEKVAEKYGLPQIKRIITAF